MGCSIIRDENGKLIETRAPNGNKSILFDSIVELQPDKEEALKLWAQVYTPSFKQFFGDWESYSEYLDIAPAYLEGSYKAVFDSNPEEVLFQIAMQANSSASEKVWSC
jgi:hypothetical protein